MIIPPPTIIVTGLILSKKAGFLKWIVPGFSFGCSEAGSLKATEGGFGEVASAGVVGAVGEAGVAEKSADGAAVVSGAGAEAAPRLSIGMALGVSCMVAVASSGTSLMACWIIEGSIVGTSSGEEEAGGV